MAEKNKGAGPALSLWALLARSSLYKIAAVLAVMAAAEGILFYNGYLKQRYTWLDGILDGSHISRVFLAALGLVVFILAWTEGRLDRKSSAAMGRLRLSGRSIYVIKAAYNILCIVLLFAVQIWLCILMVTFYGKEAGDSRVFPQRLFLAFYRNEFLHCLLPMAEAWKWMRNALLLLAFGTEAAGRGKKNYVPLVLLYVVTASWFVSSLGGGMLDVVSGGVYAVVIAVNVWRAWKEDGGDDRDC